MGLSKKQNDRFEKYAPFYDLQGKVDENNESSQQKVERQKYLYETLLGKGIKNTAIRELIDITMDEIRMQYVRKEHFENRTGFLLALWGILLGAVLANDNLVVTVKLIIDSGIKNSIFDICISIVVIIAAGYSIYDICQVLSSRNFRLFNLYDRDNNFKCAVEDKKLFFVVQLESMTNVWYRNEKEIIRKSNNFDKAVKWMIIYAIVIFVAYVM